MSISIRFESAIPLFKRASDISPSEPKWMLMIASCYRRMGNQQKAYNMYVIIKEWSYIDIM